MGNMVCVHNIVAACAVVGLSGREGEVLKKTFMPFVLYGIIAGVICTLLVSAGGMADPIPAVKQAAMLLP